MASESASAMKKVCTSLLEIGRLAHLILNADKRHFIRDFDDICILASKAVQTQTYE